MTTTVFCVNCGVQSYVDGVQTHIMGCSSTRSVVHTSDRRKPTEAEVRAINAFFDALQRQNPNSDCVIVGMKSGAIGTTDVILPMVRAVIRSMYEPDETMLRAYMGALEQPACPTKEPWHKAKMRKRWRAMLDAASPTEAPAVIAYKVLRNIPGNGFGTTGFCIGETVYQSLLVSGIDHRPDAHISVTRSPDGEGGYYCKVPLSALELVSKTP